MSEEAQCLVTTIQQMELSLVDEKANGQYHLDDNELQITYPLNRCITFLREKHGAMSKLHRERYEQVKSKPPNTLGDARLTNRTRRGPRVVLLPFGILVCHSCPSAYFPRLVHIAHF